MKVNSMRETTVNSLSLLKDMLRLRRFEEKCAELYTQQKIRGFLHLYVGEEAVATGVISVLGPEDSIVSTYREHGHALARGVSMNTVLAEMYGKVNGCSGGRGGSMHLFDAKTHFYGGNAIVAAGLPLATGLAFAVKKRIDKNKQEQAAVICFFGEGAVAEGEFHESLNLAALWQLPVLFICENNRYAMGTALVLSESEQNISLKAKSYGMHTQQVDGMDVLAVQAATQNVLAEMRATGEPAFMECLTYRFRGHSMFDAQLYREASEIKQWELKCPIRRFIKILREQNKVDDKILAEIEEDIAKEINQAVQFSETGSWENLVNLYKDVYTGESL